MVAKIERHEGELLHWIGFIVTNSRLPVTKVVKVCNGRGDGETEIKKRKEHTPLGQD